MQRSQLLNARHTQGFSLTELMIVVVIFGILAAIAYPSYVDQVRKSKRSVAKSALLDIANRQEQFFFNNRVYTADMSNAAGGLGFPSDPAYFGDDGAPASSSDAVYSVDATLTGGGTGFLLTATPRNGQIGDGCGDFTLSSTNVRAVSTSASNCW